MADIFLSYARADRARIETLAAAFEAAGYSVWWDRRLQSGSEFSKDIEAQLSAAAAVVVCWSEHANESRWVRDEANAGAEAGKLLAVSLDGAAPPIGFRQFHASDLSGWEGARDDAGLADLISAVAARLGEGAPAPVAAAPSSASTTPSSAAPTPAWWRSLQRPLSLAIIAVALIAIISPIAYFASGGGEDAVADSALVEPPRIAVAPIAIVQDTPDMTATAQALREKIAAGLSRFSMFAVTAAGNDDARYRLDSTLQRDSDALRVIARLTDIQSGRQIWGETFDRSLGDQTLFAIQDDITDHLVASVADPHGALARDLQAPVATKSPDALTPYEAVINYSIFRRGLGPDAHLTARTALERAAQEAPRNADVFASLAAAIVEEIKHDYNVKPDGEARALAAARRAVEIDSDNAFAWFALAETQYFLRDLGAFRAAAKKSIALNPRDTEALAMLGILMGYAGEWEICRDWTQRAIDLNPSHPGWYRFGLFLDAYRQGQYAEALAHAKAVNIPSYYGDPFSRAMAHGQLGDIPAAQAAAAELAAVFPTDFSNFEAIALDRWAFAQPALRAKFVEGLRKAGLDIGGDDAAQFGTTSVAVLPFAAYTEDKQDAYFGRGLATELQTALARIADLDVTAPTSTMALENPAGDAASVGAALGVDHIVDGSVRRAGERLRITAQLRRASDGVQLWSQTFERAASDIFAIEDEIVREIARTLEVRLGVGQYRQRADASGVDPAAYEDYLRGLAAWGARMRVDDARAEAQTAFLNAVDRDPDFADAWAGLATVGAGSAGSPLSRDYDAFVQQTDNAFERALALDPDNGETHAMRAVWLLRDTLNLAAARDHLDRAVALAPNAVATYYAAATYHKKVGDVEQATRALDRAVALDPLNVAGANLRAHFLAQTGRTDDAFAFFEACYQETCMREGFLAFVMTYAAYTGDADLIATWRPRYEAFEAALENIPSAAKPRVTKILPAYFSILLDRPDKAARIEELIALYRDDPVTDYIGMWGPVFADVLPEDLFFFAMERAAAQGETFSYLHSLDPFYGVNPYPDWVLRHPRYKALWTAPGLQALANARRENGWVDGLPVEGREGD